MMQAGCTVWIENRIALSPGGLFRMGRLSFKAASCVFRERIGDWMRDETTCYD